VEETVYVVDDDDEDGENVRVLFADGKSLKLQANAT
jgi:hypothetical protein